MAELSALAGRPLTERDLHRVLDVAALVTRGEPTQPSRSPSRQTSRQHENPA
ncbi:hypothetical protein ABGB16_25490 [Micromonospora sp. B11E3]|uniref:hypothetical protein n=1 Tax=Micromonospora sp. B11E3 TaxID=3153562 RepID=UPI00325E9442